MRKQSDTEVREELGKLDTLVRWLEHRRHDLEQELRNRERRAARKAGE